LYIGALRILLHRARAERGLAELKPGIALAGSLIEAALQDGYVPFALELLLVRAGLHAALGDGPAGRADVARALELGQPEGYLSIFVEEGPALAANLNDLLERGRTGKVRPEYIRQILAAFQVSPPSPASAGDSSASATLTEREQEVLGLMAGGMKYEEIAAKLFISLNTVRSHVKAIYAKFGVDNRTRAIEMGRQRRIL
jgi:LuxR family maltose regulon positive regulatory protein